MTHPLARKRVLIVEDEYFVAMNIAGEIAARGAVAVGPAATVDGALKAIKNADVDGAILDINLRGKSCFPVADALADRHIPFVFATGYSTAQVPGRHVNVPRFEKPTAPSVICAALEEAMESGGDGLPRS
jgi:DNA-binding LytR/AlgR family response regulator